jgi:hypothetical protein
MRRQIVATPWTSIQCWQVVFEELLISTTSTSEATTDLRRKRCTMVNRARQPMQLLRRWPLVVVALNLMISGAPTAAGVPASRLRKKIPRVLQTQTTEYKVLLHLSLQFVDDNLAAAFEDRTSSTVNQFCAVINSQVRLFVFHPEAVKYFHSHVLCCL